MLKFLDLKNEAFGLDLSDFSLKIAKLKKKGGFYDLISFNETRIKSGIIIKGEIRKPDELAEIIKKTIKEIKGKKITTKNAVISLSEEKSFLQVIQMPWLSEQDLKSAIIFEAENHIPLPIEQVYLDYQIISPANNNAKNIDVLLVGFPKKIIDSYVSCFEKANIKPVVLETESLALSRSLIKNQVAEKPVMIIDFGANRTIFTIFSDCSVKFVFSIPISSQGFSEVIARTMKIDLDMAEKLKTEYGLLGKIKLEIKNDQSIKKEEKGEVFEALIPALTDLIEQIKKYLDYSKTYMNGKEIEKILICGNGAKLKGFIPFLSSELDIEVQAGNPWVNILNNSVQIKEKKFFSKKEQSLGHATVLGLALRGVKK